MNTGRIYVADRGDVDILGGFGDVEARFRFASGSGSVARVEAVLASADSDGDDYGADDRFGDVVLLHDAGTHLISPASRPGNRRWRTDVPRRATGCRWVYRRLRCRSGWAGALFQKRGP